MKKNEFYVIGGVNGEIKFTFEERDNKQLELNDWNEWNKYAIGVCLFPFMLYLDQLIQL